MPICRVALLWALTVSAPVFAALPPWLQDAVARKPPAFPNKVPVVLLHKEEHLTVDSAGRRKILERGAMRLLQAGHPGISAYRSYIKKTGRIAEFRAWVVSPTGQETLLPKERILDISGGGGELNDESRAKLIECPRDASPGSVFAWEIVEEESTIFTQYHYSFQDREPVLVSRFSITLPPGWEVAGTALNHAPIEPRIDGPATSWELRDLEALEREEHSPGWAALAPRLGVSYFPADERAGLRPLKNWKAVSGWLSDLSDPSAAVTPEIQAKADSLVVGATSEADRIAAIAAFVQQTRYISVQLNINRGGGYVPHPAADVLRKNYGDCKDKVALMRALLRAAGIASYDVSIFSGNRRFVRPEWAATLQFNHAIIAIRVSTATDFPAVLEHAELGRLLFFDPTDPSTFLGDLPSSEQGSYALVQAGLQGDLVVVPALPASSSRSEAKISAAYTSTGSVDAESVRVYQGQSAAAMRRMTSDRDQAELKKYFEASLQQRLGGLDLKAVEHRDDRSNGSFELRTRFAAARFGQIMQDRLLVLQPGLLAGSGVPVFHESERTQPVQLRPLVRKDSVTIEIPENFDLDEMPEAVEEDSPYGTYHASWKFAGKTLTFEQSLEIKDTLAPPSELPAIRAFLGLADGGAGAPVVFIKR